MSKWGLLVKGLAMWLGMVAILPIAPLLSPEWLRRRVAALKAVRDRIVEMQVWAEAEHRRCKRERDMTDIKWPKHKAGMCINHNQHLINYITVEKELEIFDDYYESAFKNDEARQRCIDTNELWSVQWYPETPVGFCVTAASTLEEAVAYALEVESQP